jgi:hypothetical protein
LIQRREETLAEFSTYELDTPSAMPYHVLSFRVGHHGAHKPQITQAGQEQTDTIVLLKSNLYYRGMMHLGHLL